MSFEILKFLWSFLLIFFRFFNSIVQKLKLKLVSSFDFFFGLFNCMAQTEDAKWREMLT